MNYLGQQGVVGILVPEEPLMVDAATALLYSSRVSERFGHHVNTTPTAALPVNFDLQTSSRIDPNKRNLTGGVLTDLTVGPLPEQFGVPNGS